MTVSRKDLNAIASTFNRHLQNLEGKLYPLVNDSPTDVKLQMIAIVQSSRSMFLTLQKINPKVDWEKWHTAITKDLCYSTMTTINANFGTVPE
mgnify:CR=1 FL=1